ncbi:MAG: hypothetical protein GY762_03075 [Proteobacteria bacterium]|nr:hypothetical protein [Pseudomonadota bacterium]
MFKNEATVENYKDEPWFLYACDEDVVGTATIHCEYQNIPDSKGMSHYELSETVWFEGIGINGSVGYVGHQVYNNQWTWLPGVQDQWTVVRNLTVINRKTKEKGTFKFSRHYTINHSGDLTASPSG